MNNNNNKNLLQILSYYKIYIKIYLQKKTQQKYNKTIIRKIQILTRNNDNCAEKIKNQAKR